MAKQPKNTWDKIPKGEQEGLFWRTKPNSNEIKFTNTELLLSETFVEINTFFNVERKLELYEDCIALFNP